MSKTSGPREWEQRASRCLRAESVRCGRTPLLRFPLPAEWGIDLYLKDESAHPTGSLKHRLGRCLFQHAIASGWIGETTPVLEASSGSTAVSEAYFARLLGLSFTAVMPATTSPAKIALIEAHGGECELVDDPAAIYREAERLALARHGHNMDQFTNGERATDWRGADNIAAEIFEQMSLEEHPVPSWVVVGAGTGATATTFGRYLRDRQHPTGLRVVDPEHSAFYEGWLNRNPHAVAKRPSRIEGIGRPRVEPSFVSQVVDEMARVPDGASVAATRFTSARLGRTVGGSTGTNVWGAMELVARMRDAGERGSVVTLICDGGERYGHSYYDDAWVAGQGLALEPYAEVLERVHAGGAWPEASLS